MKKILLILITLLSVLSFSSCKKETTEIDSSKVSIIMPTGTPALGLAEYVYSAKTDGKIDVEIVGGADLLKTAFINKSHDIIVAPVNLGAMMYKNYESYVLYKTFVWGNLYLVSKGTLTSLSDINNKKVVVFGQNSTPDIVFKAILAAHTELNVEIEYADDVSSANTLLSTSKAEYIISAEPSLSKLKTKQTLNVIDLQDEWSRVSGNSSYPQAAIFVKKGSLNVRSIQTTLRGLTDCIENILSNKEACARSAVLLHTSFETLGEETLISAIPNCHYQILDSDKDAVNYYIQKMIDLGFGAQVGGSLPREDFFA